MPPITIIDSSPARSSTAPALSATTLLQDRRSDDPSPAHFEVPPLSDVPEDNIQIEAHVDSRRGSIEPPQTFVEGRHVGPTAGVSFLYWSRHDVAGGPSMPHSEAGDASHNSVPLMTYGDLPYDPVSSDGLEALTAHSVNTLLEKYFRFATPTYRFMHQATLEQWAKLYVDGRRQPAPQEACVLLACAQSLLYTKSGNRYSKDGDEDVKTSKKLSEKAKALLDRETGYPSISSVQARLALCLLLLGTFRMNECRFAFSFTATLVTSLGLHRRQSSSASHLTLLERETRRRTFWCVYVLDGYLGVMLGRPRLFRDEDIDQPYPQNISDSDLLSSDSLDVVDLPLHGNLEAFIGHIGLAKLMGENNDLLYPLYCLTEDVILQRTNHMLDRLDKWTKDLPDFLKPREKTLTGSRTFERQNTVLKLGHAHMRILATRRCLLADFSRLGKPTPNRTLDTSSLRPIQECFHYIVTIIDTVSSLIQGDSLHQSFWFVQYIAIVAISTLYVFQVQGGSRGLPASIDVANTLQKAKECQKYLATLAPEGSQAKRHYQLLDRLKRKAENHRGQTRSRRPATSMEGDIRPQEPKLSASADLTAHSSMSLPATTRTPDAGYSSVTTLNNQMQGISPDSVNQEPAYLSAEFTPVSELDYDFQSAFNLGWESLDTIGFLSNDGGYHFQEN